MCCAYACCAEPGWAARVLQVVRVEGVMYPWAAAAPMVLGRLAFGDSGGRWEALIRRGAAIPVPGGGSAAPQPQPPPGPTTPLEEPMAVPAPASPGGGGWRLWPFGSWKGGATPAPAEAKASHSAPVAADAKAAVAAAAARAGRRLGKRSLVPSGAQLESLGLVEGQNVVEFVLQAPLFGEHRLRAYMHLLRWNSWLVISDVDGTITRSDVLGHLLPPMGLDWSHAGVARLLSDIDANGYAIMFLSSRAIAQASLTRDYLHSLTQDGHKLPVGPVVISPDGLIPSLYREMVVRRPHEFKIATLQSIRNLFPPFWNPFFAGFGNRGTDEISYKAVGIPPGKVFTINPRGEIRRSTGAVVGSLLGSLAGINTLVNEVFPPQVASKGESVRTEFNDAAFWRPPILAAHMIDSDDEG